MKISIVLCMICLILATAKEATVPVSDLIKAANNAYGCGLIDGFARAIKGQSDAPQYVHDSVKKLRADSGCDKVDVLLGLNK